MIKKYLCLTLLLISSTGFTVAPYFSIRSQSENIARELAGSGWNTQINFCCNDNCYSNFSITPEYTRSFRPCNIAECLFGCSTCEPCTPCNFNCNSGNSCNSCRTCYDSCDDDCYRIRITGSLRNDRCNNDWMADYFGLPTDYKSYVTFEPRIDNFLADFNFYVGMDEWCKGMYFRIHAPIVHTRWNLNMQECAEDEGSANHWPGYFNKWFIPTNDESNAYGIPRNNLTSKFTSFISGCNTINLAGLYDATNPNYIRNDIVFKPLRHAKMDCCKKTKTAFSDLQMALGWNFWCDDDYHVGLNIRAAAPTGNRPEGCYLFEPIVGNGKHWELGGGFSSHWTFWRDECECKSMAFYLDANITHLFKSKQCRTFDLCCKPLSRYMLATKFKTPVEELYAGETVPLSQPIKQFAGVYSPVANLTTIPVDVSVGVQGDLAFMLQYIHNNWSFDIGYNFWGTSCEKIELRCECGEPFEENTWALKGDAFMYGFIQQFGSNPALYNPGIALSPSQSGATIFKGTNNPPDGINNIIWARNPGVDKRKSTELYIYDDIGQSDNINTIYTSLDPEFLSLCDIDRCGAQTKGRSHKLFVNFDYTWCERECWVPYIGLGIEAEFAQKPCDDWCNDVCDPCGTSCGPCYQACQPACCSQCCDRSCCCTCGISQWGLWIKGGFAYY